MTKTRLLASFIILAFASKLPAQEVTVGVRPDARPFVYQENNEYRGFLFELCDAALEEAGLEPEWRLVNGGDRLPRIGASGDLDILCDPFTVTTDRASKLVLSQILFVSGGGYLLLPDRIDKLGPVAFEELRRRREAGKPVDNFENRPITDPAGNEEKRQVRVLPCTEVKPNQIATVRIGVLSGSTATHIVDNAMMLPDDDSEAIRRNSFETVCYEEFDTHKDGMERLCRNWGGGKPYPLSYYFGDRDILVALLNDRSDCQHAEIELGKSLFSLEPYAVALSPRTDSGIILRFQDGLIKAISEKVPFESQNGETLKAARILALFQKYFKGKTMSPTLQSMYTALLATYRPVER